MAICLIVLMYLELGWIDGQGLGALDPLTFNYQEGVTGTVKFDLCQVIDCGEEQSGYQLAEKYVCEVDNQIICSPLGQKYAPSRYSSECGCPYWSNVICNSGVPRWGYSPARASRGPDPLTQRMTIYQGQTPTSCSKKACNPMHLTLTNPKPSDTGLYMLGMSVSGQDPLGHFQIKITRKTLVPDNASPEGSFTKALHGLQALSKELHDNSGIDNPFTSHLESWFGRWSALASSVSISFAVIAFITICGCCFFLCARGHALRWIDSAVTQDKLNHSVPINKVDYSALDLTRAEEK
ncbi:uncharacterized protein LOC108413900 [Pygocentrus nattereri]|uniref:uncharacterized protein LOC108413900 n=1 Tax=Pygocentrus nattereri TaxID=42514 RepID=UPI0008149AAB|nr:uncharacterized protein LOC108413900 [Pygocentrus nattereri]